MEKQWAELQGIRNSTQGMRNDQTQRHLKINTKKLISKQKPQWQGSEYHDTSEMSKTDILKPKISFFPLVYNEGYKEY